MKINRFIALAAIALLVVGAMGAVSLKAFAQSTTPPAQSQGCDQQDDDAAEVQNAPDTDNVEQECGDQTTSDNGQESESAESDSQDAAPTGTPAITAAAAQKTAEEYLNVGDAVKVELDDENGALVYSVEFSNGTDVKVDAMTGSILGTEPTED
jgi:uncharacterized membrane protein YkoI